MEHQQKIINDVCKRNIDQSTYDIARKECANINPNDVLAEDDKRNTAILLCTSISKYDIEFARVWFSLEFKVPIDWDAQNYGDTFLQRVLRADNRRMLSAIMESKSGIQFLLQHETRINSKLLDIYFSLSDCPIVYINSFKVVVCYTTIETFSYTNHCTCWSCRNNGKSYKMIEDFCKSPKAHRYSMRILCGFGRIDATQVFCMALLIKNKFFTIC